MVSDTTRAHQAFILSVWKFCMVATTRSAVSKNSRIVAQLENSETYLHTTPLLYVMSLSVRNLVRDS